MLALTLGIAVSGWGGKTQGGVRMSIQKPVGEKEKATGTSPRKWVFKKPPALIEPQLEEKEHIRRA